MASRTGPPTSASSSPASVKILPRSVRTDPTGELAVARACTSTIDTGSPTGRLAGAAAVAPSGDARGGSSRGRARDTTVETSATGRDPAAETHGVPRRRGPTTSLTG